MKLIKMFNHQVHQGHQVRKRQNNVLGLKPKFSNHKSLKQGSWHLCASFSFSLTQELFALLGALGVLGGSRFGLSCFGGKL